MQGISDNVLREAAGVEARTPKPHARRAEPIQRARGNFDVDSTSDKGCPHHVSRQKLVFVLAGVEVPVY